MTAAHEIKPFEATITNYVPRRDARAARNHDVARALRAPAARRRGPVPRRRDAPRVEPGDVRGRPAGKAHVETIGAVVLDFDGGVAVEAAVAAWRLCFGLVHTTRKHRADAPRLRVILPTSRPMTPDEHAIVWAWAAARALAVGHKADRSTKDASRFWYVPGPAGGPFEAVDLDGELVDVDRIVDEARAARASAAQVPTAVAPPRRDERDHAHDRAARYLATLPPAVAGQQGHAATLKAAIALVRGFDLPHADALELLVRDYNPRCVPPGIGATSSARSPRRRRPTGSGAGGSSTRRRRRRRGRPRAARPSNT